MNCELERSGSLSVRELSASSPDKRSTLIPVDGNLRDSSDADEDDIVSNIQMRFPSTPLADIRKALEYHGGHGGKAVRMLQRMQEFGSPSESPSLASKLQAIALKDEEEAALLNAKKEIWMEGERKKNVRALGSIPVKPKKITSEPSKPRVKKEQEHPEPEPEPEKDKKKEKKERKKKTEKVEAAEAADTTDKKLKKKKKKKKDEGDDYERDLQRSLLSY